MSDPTIEPLDLDVIEARARSARYQCRDLDQYAAGLLDGALDDLDALAAEVRQLREEIAGLMVGNGELPYRDRRVAAAVLRRAVEFGADAWLRDTADRIEAGELELPEVDHG